MNGKYVTVDILLKKDGRLDEVSFDFKAHDGKDLRRIDIEDAFAQVMDEIWHMIEIKPKSKEHLDS